MDLKKDSIKCITELAGNKKNRTNANLFYFPKNSLNVKMKSEKKIWK